MKVSSDSHIRAIVVFKCFIRVQEECIRVPEEFSWLMPKPRKMLHRKIEMGYLFGIDMIS